MSKEVSETTQSLVATSEKIAKAYADELVKLGELREQYLHSKEQFTKMPKLDLFSDEHWEKLKIEISDSIKTIDTNITYITTQLKHLKKAQDIFASDDIDAIKAAVGDYLKTDTDLSLKTMAIFRFDYTETKQSIDVILQYGHKEE